MINIKNGEELMVAAILDSLSYGPQMPYCMIFNFETVKSLCSSEAHVSLVCDQLLLVGAVCQLPDGRYVINASGEEVLDALIKAHRDEWLFNGVTMQCLYHK